MEIEQHQQSGPQTRCLERGADWTLYEHVCEAGPQDRPFEERHDAFSIATVLAGTFTYVSERGRALLHPGALLLGNHGACYSCGHGHSAGDVCLSAQFKPEYFAEIAATAAASSRFRFPASMLQARRDMLFETALLEAKRHAHDRLGLEETLLRFVTIVVRSLSGTVAEATKVSALDERRVSRAVHHMESHCEDALDLAALAGIAAMSKFHFLRVFRRSIGMTPYQFLLGLRLRRAASRLLTTPERVSAVAFSAGFGDLSTFNATFRAWFGMSPSQFRKRGNAP
ncbi:MAG: AraC family transcriptional regulator [Hyphomicrobiales bacterium]